jgi:omega-6 fatty acid desaturase (delta-12 desaturase)
VSTIPFYHAGEASVHIKRVMGQHYKADVKTPFWTAFWKNQRTCKFVEETAGAEGSGVYMYRNLNNRAGETQPQRLAVGEKLEVKESKSSMATAMASSRNLDARRRLSQSAQLRANLPLLADG